MNPKRKRNSYDIYKERLAQLELELETYHRKARLTPMLEEFKELLGVTLTQIPFKNWPEFAKQCLESLSRTFPASIQEFKQHLK